MSEAMWISAAAILISLSSIATSIYSVRIEHKIKQLRKADDE